MKVIQKTDTPKNTTFSNIQFGQCFSTRYRIVVIKTDPGNDSNAVDLTSGIRLHYNDNEPVSEVHAEIVIK